MEESVKRFVGLDDDPRWFADYPRSPSPPMADGNKNYNYLTSRKRLIIPQDVWDEWNVIDEILKNEEREVPPTCRLLLDELKASDAYNKLSAETCVRMMDLLIMAHNWCLSGKCSSSNAKELLVDNLYTRYFGPVGKRRGEEHFDLLEKMVPDLIHRCVELHKCKVGESRQDDLDLKRKRFLIEDEKSSALSPAPILGNQNMETELASSPVILSKKQVLSASKGIDGARVGKILDLTSITLNKNSVPGLI